MKRKVYTTTEYLDALKLESDGNLYCSNKDFQFFSNKGAADFDAQWLVNLYKIEGKKVRKPRVVEVTFKVVKGKGK